MIDVTPYIDRLEKLKDDIVPYIKALSIKYRPYYRIIDDQIKFPNNFEWIKHDEFMELSNHRWNKYGGWHKPDRECGNIEIHYLWKDSFQLYLNKFKNEKQISKKAT